MSHELDLDATHVRAESYQGGNLTLRNLPDYL